MGMIWARSQGNIMKSLITLFLATFLGLAALAIACGPARSGVPQAPLSHEVPAGDARPVPVQRSSEGRAEIEAQRMDTILKSSGAISITAGLLYLLWNLTYTPLPDDARRFAALCKARRHRVRALRQSREVIREWTAASERAPGSRSPLESRAPIRPSAQAPSRWTLLAALAAISLALTSCAGILGRPEKGITIRDEARVCFRQSEEGHILASIAPSDCYSMRTTRVLQESGVAVLDQREQTVRFESHFLLTRTRSLLPDSSDCAGGGRLDFDLGILEVGLYDVYLWDELLGELSVTSGLPWRDQCLPTNGAD